MKRNFFTICFGSLLVAGSLASCTKDLDRFPVNDETSATVYSTVDGYTKAAAKVYGAFALTGNAGPAGSGDVAGIDEGTSDFLRLFWKAQELSTDEAIVAWNDPGIQDFHNMNWSSSNPMLQGLYYRSIQQIAFANEFIRESSDDKLAGRGISGADAEKVRKYRAEARFLRAFQYWVLMDLYGNPPFIDETSAVGTFNPPQIKRADLFAFIEKELKELETQLVAPRTNEYGRADQAAAWSLLSRMYLNANTYIGAPKFTEAITYANKVIAAGYSLNGNYRQLFLADNHLNTNENIFTINYDGLRTQNFGGTTFLVHASIGGDMNAADFGVGGGWGGIRSTRNLPDLFPDPSGNTDRRAQFFQSSLEINDVSKFTDGWAVTKFRNKTRGGQNGSDPGLTFVDNDFQLFRLGEILLNYAEAVLQGGSGGSRAQALTYVNQLRTRAFNGSSAGNITDSELNLNFILAERGRELHWEGLRRTDLIRFNRFTEATYLWPWKGGVKNGTGVSSFRKLYPLPSSDVVANPNLTQNAGY